MTTERRGVCYASTGFAPSPERSPERGLRSHSSAAPLPIESPSPLPPRRSLLNQLREQTTYLHLPPPGPRPSPTLTSPTPYSEILPTMPYPTLNAIEVSRHASRPHPSSSFPLSIAIRP